jgi:hypothetical protein
MDECRWVDGWWVDVKAGLRKAYSNQQDWLQVHLEEFF